MISGQWFSRHEDPAPLGINSPRRELFRPTVYTLDLNLDAGEEPCTYDGKEEKNEVLHLISRGLQTTVAWDFQWKGTQE